MTTTSSERKKIRMRFVGIYILSLLLAFVVMTAFWQKLSDKKTPDTALQASEKETYFMQLDTALHQKMEEFDELCKTYVRSRQAGTDPDPNSLQFANASLGDMIDSVDKQAGFLSEGPKKAAMDLAVAKFKKEFAARQTIMNGITALPKGAFNTKTTTDNNATGNSDVEALKQSLQEKDETIAVLQKQVQLNAIATSGTADDGLQKAVADRDKTIASLQAQLRQKEAALQNGSTQNPPASGGDWQQKYHSLKASFDKMAASEKSLRSAYQAVADDNRRLLSQLQSSRKG